LISNLNIEELIGMKVQELRRNISANPGVGLQPSADDVIGMKVQGVTPSYVKEDARPRDSNQILTS